MEMKTITGKNAHGHQWVIRREKTAEDYLFPAGEIWPVLPREGEEFLLTDDDTHETIFEGVVSKVRWSVGTEGCFSVFIHVSESDEGEAA